MRWLGKGLCGQGPGGRVKLRVRVPVPQALAGQVGRGTGLLSMAGMGYRGGPAWGPHSSGMALPSNTLRGT